MKNCQYKTAEILQQAVAKVSELLSVKKSKKTFTTTD